MFIWEPGPTPPIPDPTLQKALQESAPPLELLKTTPTGYLGISLLSFRESPRSCFALLNLILLIQFNVAYCIGGGTPKLGIFKILVSEHRVFLVQ